ncbi:phosphatase PAP2 family protein [Neisseria sp. Ec49-e6-T10]|uniref:phosphatase PAP2 family protein n=1 Tax=Neisseria sp. Ec49-e6-T10 TaxID=3140744 RepID=UPI003EC04792
MYQRLWQLKQLCLFTSISILLLVLWLTPSIHGIIKQTDSAFFLILNQPLAKYPLWAYFWDVLSTRLSDLLSACVMLYFLIKGDFIFKKEQTRQAFLGCLILMILLLMVRVIFDKWVNTSGLQHASPSLVVPGAFRLTEHIPIWWHVLEPKDASNRSFPGDHASVLLVWAFFVSFYAKKWTHWVAIWLVTLFFMMPRLVAGAHWASDNYIGGVFLALMAFTWSIYTPLLYKVTQFLLNKTECLFQFAQKIPIVNLLSVVKYKQ